MADVDLSSVVSIATAVAERSVTAEEVVTACLQRIISREDELCAWANLDPDNALAQARTLDRLEAPRGPLHGVPVGVKDIIDTADQPTRHGSPIYAENRPVRDAVVVERLRAAGAVIVGKTVTTEFALFTPGPTVNPHDPGRTPGGSSSGSAAAVADGQIPLAIGTQTAGSVVRPASFCGVVGAKPTLGVLPRDGVKLCSSTLDTVGLLGQNIDDVALGLGLMAGDVDRFRPVSEVGLRIGFCRTPWWDAVDPACAATVEEAASRLADHLEVVEVALPADFAPLVEAQTTVMSTELLDELAVEIVRHRDQLSEGLRERLDDAAGQTGGYAQAIEHRDRCLALLPGVFGDVDVLLAPSVVGEAPVIATTGDPLFCRPWTLLGTPTVAVPGLHGPSGLPLGVQVIAPLGADGLALGAADRIGQLLTS